MDDVVRNRLPKDLLQASRVMSETGTFESGQGLMRDAAEEICSLRHQLDQIMKIERECYSLRDCDEGMKKIRDIFYSPNNSEEGES